MALAELPEESEDFEAARLNSTEALEHLEVSDPTPESVLSMSATRQVGLAPEDAVAAAAAPPTRKLPSLSQLSVELLDIALNL